MVTIYTYASNFTSVADDDGSPMLALQFPSI